MRNIEEIKAAIKKLVDECNSITFLINLCKLLQLHNSIKK